MITPDNDHITISMVSPKNSNVLLAMRGVSEQAVQDIIHRALGDILHRYACRNDGMHDEQERRAIARIAGDRLAALILEATDARYISLSSVAEETVQ